MRASIPFVVFSFAFAACGGNVVVDPSAGAGAGSTSSTTASGSSSRTSASSAGPSSTSATSSSSGGCGEKCHATPPAAGSPCACDGESCDFNQCPQDGLNVNATCTAGVWRVTSSGCEGSPCGTSICNVGEICLHQVALGSTTTCVPNPCAPGALACGCATSLCDSTTPGFTCSVTGSDLYCACNFCDAP